MKKMLSLIALLLTTVATFAAEPKVFTDEAHVTSAGKTTDYTDKEVVLTETASGVYTVTFRKLAPMPYKTFGDFVIENVKATTDDASGETTFTTESTEAKWTNVTSSAALGGVTEGTSVTLNSFKATLSPDENTLVLEFNFVSMGADVNVAYGESYKEPATIVEDYEYADHLVIYDPDFADTKMVEMDGAHVFFDVYSDNTVRIKFSKVEIENYKYDFTFTGTFTKQTDGDVTRFACRGAEGEASQKALFGGVVPTLDVDGIVTGERTIYMNFKMNGNGFSFSGEFGTDTTNGISTVDATTDNRIVAIYTLGGVRTNNLQRGVNIVRTADGKVKKMLVK